MCILLLVLLLRSARSEYLSNVIDVDDILDNDFMPSRLMVLENPQEYAREFKNTTVEEDDALKTSKNGDGSFDSAFSTMGFHRLVTIALV